jgi:hypothetical protein
VGALETMLGAPYTPASIAAGLLGYALVVTTGQWAVMSGLGALALLVSSRLHHDGLPVGGGYLVLSLLSLLSLLLPLLLAWVGAAPALLLSLLFPRLSLPGQGGLAGNGSAVVSIVAILPGCSALLTLALGLGNVTLLRLLLGAGGVTAAVIVGSLLGIARGFRPESVLGSS